MVKVLRLRVGDEIDVSDSSEWEYHTVITDLQEDCAEVKILDKQRFAREPETLVTLYQGVPKQGKMELIIQKNVGLGVNRIVPVFMERSVVKDNGKFGKKIGRWQKVADEAVKQCKRGIIPEVCDAISTKEMIAEFAEYDLVLFPYENENGTTIKDELRAIADGCVMNEVCELNEGRKPGNGGKLGEGRMPGEGDKPGEGCKSGMKIAVVIGPEGGFADSEAERIVAAGGKSVSLGKTILRTETAGMAALSMIMYELEM